MNLKRRRLRPFGVAVAAAGCLLCAGAVRFAPSQLAAPRVQSPAVAVPTLTADALAASDAVALDGDLQKSRVNLDRFLDRDAARMVSATRNISGTIVRVREGRFGDPSLYWIAADEATPTLIVINSYSKVVWPHVWWSGASSRLADFSSLDFSSGSPDSVGRGLTAHVRPVVLPKTSRTLYFAQDVTVSDR